MEFVIVTGQMVLNVAPDIARTCAYAQDVQNFPAVVSVPQLMRQM